MAHVNVKETCSMPTYSSTGWFCYQIHNQPLVTHSGESHLKVSNCWADLLNNMVLDFMMFNSADLITISRHKIQPKT